MRVSDFDYDLPEALIAQHPLPERTASRLLCLDGASGALAERTFAEIDQLLVPGDLLVLNDTRVIPARLFGRKPTGGRVEVLVERVLDEARILAQARASKGLRPGGRVQFDGGGEAEVLAVHGDLVELRIERAGSAGNVLEWLAQAGQVPLPPYIRRSPEPGDVDRYQTVYARRDGAVAAPTAGLHFDDALLARLADAEVGIARVTLHVGAGTFQPVRVTEVEAHRMHPEYLEVSEAVCGQVEQTRARGARVVAVGTTSVRALEAASREGTIRPMAGNTDLFIYPGYRFRTVDAMVTNFHLPGSTLLMLVCAFAGRENVLRAYRQAVAQRFRFFSYGDAMFLTRQTA